MATTQLSLLLPQTVYGLPTASEEAQYVSSNCSSIVPDATPIGDQYIPRTVGRLFYAKNTILLSASPHINADDSKVEQTSKHSAMKKNGSKRSPNSSHTLGDSPGSDDTPTNGVEAAAAAKPKRVRTGCLTCRERHLKCDEGTPICQNCKKSNRPCKRGVRLNFIDTQVGDPPFLLPPTHDWQVTFQDESVDIASEYKGGRAKYSIVKREEFEMPAEMNYDYPSAMGAPTMSHQPLPQVGGGYPTYAEPAAAIYGDSSNDSYQNPSHSTAASSYSEPQQQVRQSYDHSFPMQQPTEEHAPPYMDTSDEVLYMQVFVEEVGLWMDSMDAEKHFSQLLPFQALRQPMLKHAFLACGVRHLTLVNSAYPDEKALKYYNNATQLLLKSLQNPDRDSVLCATTATILNVYEVMSEKALQRMNHIAGARALIKECRWDARTPGIGGACFWLNVGLELFSCLHFNWGIAWDPDSWGVDTTMVPQQFGGNEEDWTHKILFILAKITNFRSTIPQFQEQTVHAEQMRLHSRNQAWMTLKQFCDKWNECIPLTMHPMAYLPPYQTVSKSSFPEVWIIKRATIVARLFYHTAMALLGSMHPLASINQPLAEEMAEMKLYHSRQICGIVAHVKDR